MNQQIINVTPHCVKVVVDGGAIVEFAPSGETLRLSQETVKVGELCAVPISRTVYGEPQLVTEAGARPLPEQKEGVFYIVSAMVKNALPEREDMLVPAEQLRDEQGRVTGCKSLGV